MSPVTLQRHAHSVHATVTNGGIAAPPRVHLKRWLLVSQPGLYTFQDSDDQVFVQSFYLPGDVLVPCPVPPGAYVVTVAESVPGATLHISTWESPQ